VPLLVGGCVQSLLNACLGEGGDGSGSGPSEVRFHASSMLPGQQQSTHVRVLKSLQSTGRSDVMCNVDMYHNPSRSDMHSLLVYMYSTLFVIARAMGYHAYAPIANMEAFWSLHSDDSVALLRVCENTPRQKKIKGVLNDALDHVKRQPPGAETPYFGATSIILPQDGIGTCRRLCLPWPCVC
jgi:hypothetical protein